MKDASTKSTEHATEPDVAVIGMAGRFPGADGVEQLWQNLREGLESVRFFSEQELIDAGVDPVALRDPDYVKAAAPLDDVESFDAAFFNFSPLEARVMDPQRRIFFECCWHALEDAGHVPGDAGAAVGVYAGAGLNTYLLQNLLTDPELIRTIGLQQLLIASDKDFLPTQVSYKLGLTGPSVNVNTACSSSLVALHLARQALLLGECDMALAGGASVVVPHVAGYVYVPGSIQSPDGHCRAFDALARGTVWGSGGGVVVMKTLDRALADGDSIRAIIKGSAINNDGAVKVGFTAPSVEGQARVIAQALAAAGVSAETIGYVEAHGTGTDMGDPIEVAALTRAFRLDTAARGFCALGSVKTNLGHLNAAAGIAGLIKAIRALETGTIPGTLHFETPNPKIDFADSPFFVNRSLASWPAPVSKGAGPARRRACVSSMGIGGTNAHVVLEESPDGASSPVALSREVDEHVVLLSAASAWSLEQVTGRLVDHLRAHPGLRLRDVAFTSQHGRKALSLRRAVRGRSIAEVLTALEERRFEPARAGDGPAPSRWRGALDAWLSGGDVDWRALHHGARPRRVRLPLYPFDRQRLWVDPRPAPRARAAADAASAVDDSFWRKRPDQTDWFYRPQWRRASLPLSPAAPSSERCLFFSDGSPLAVRLIERMRAHGPTVIVTPGPAAARPADSVFVVPTGDRHELGQMLAQLASEERLPDRIVHFWSVGGEEDVPIQDLEGLLASQEAGLFNLLALAQALADLNLNRPMRLVAFTREACEVTGQERQRFEQSAVSGVCRVLQQEYQHLICRTVDLGPELGSQDPVNEALAAALEDEVRAPCDDVLVAHRGGYRWSPYYEPIRATVAPASASTPPAVAGEAYLVYHGLEGIGFLVARSLLEAGARILFLDEAAAPPPAFAPAARVSVAGGTGDTLAVRAGHTAALRAAGFRLVTQNVDFENRAAVERAVRAAEEQLGPIRGVIHAAGASNFDRVKATRDTDREACRRHFAAIPASLIALEQLFRGRDLRFRLVMSSLGSVLGGLGFAAIASACGVAAGYAARRNATGRDLWQVQYWDSWDIEWEKARGLVPDVMYQRVAPSVLTESEGLDCFRRCLALGGASTPILTVAISATDLDRRYRKWVQLEDVRRVVAARPNGGERSSPLPVRAPAERPPSPAHDGAFVEPRTDLERAIAGLYRELLGVDRVGIHDSFHDLGGHSLLATQMLSRLREVLHVDLELFTLMSHPTVGGLAGHISSRQQGQGAVA